LGAVVFSWGEWDFGPYFFVLWGGIYNYLGTLSLAERAFSGHKGGRPRFFASCLCFFPEAFSGFLAVSGNSQRESQIARIILRKIAFLSPSRRKIFSAFAIGCYRFFLFFLFFCFHFLTANFNCYCLRKKCNSFRKPRKLLSSSAVPHNLLSLQLTLGTYCETNRKKNR
ncbi:Uncharacterized protein APZ42_003420, partial [Daphnia magna]